GRRLRRPRRARPALLHRGQGRHLLRHLDRLQRRPQHEQRAVVLGGLRLCQEARGAPRRQGPPLRHRRRARPQLLHPAGERPLPGRRQVAHHH
ncbi:hypothetical protein BN1723_019875, partial [Verticillium longisporum]